MNDKSGKPTHRTSDKKHSELSDDERKKYGANNVGVLFGTLNSALNDVWEEYSLVDFYLKSIDKSLKKDKIDRAPIPKLVRNPRISPASKNTLHGIIDRTQRKSLGRHSFIDAVSLFEHFMSMLVFKVYMDFPEKLKRSRGCLPRQ